MKKIIVILMMVMGVTVFAQTKQELKQDVRDYTGTVQLLMNIYITELESIDLETHTYTNQNAILEEIKKAKSLKKQIDNIAKEMDSGVMDNATRKELEELKVVIEYIGNQLMLQIKTVQCLKE